MGEFLLLGLIIPGFVKGWVAAIAAPIAVISLLVLALKVDTKKENIRRNAIDLSRRFRENGLTLLDELLENIAVGDKSGVIKSLIALTALVKEPEVFAAKIVGVFNHQLTKKLADPAQRAEIAKALKNAETLEKVDLQERVKAGTTN